LAANCQSQSISDSDSEESVILGFGCSRDQQQFTPRLQTVNKREAMEHGGIIEILRIYNLQILYKSAINVYVQEVLDRE
jgi:hypothetical protein